MRHLAFRYLGLVSAVSLAVALCAGQDGTLTQESQACVLSGHVTNQASGEPLSGVTLRLEAPSVSLNNLSEPSYNLFDHQPAPQQDAYVVASLSDGGFCLSSIKPGFYVLSASQKDFLNTTYGASTFSVTGKVLDVSNKPLKGIALSLAPLSGIAGRVTDDSGNALADVNVVAVKQTWIQGRATFVPVQGTQSNWQGNYHIGKLTPGEYYIFAQPTPDLRSLSAPESLTSADALIPKAIRTYYPRSLSMSGAQAVEVPVGEDLRGINVQTRNALTFHVRGRVVGQKEEWRGGSVQLMAANEEPVMIVLNGDSNLGPDGSFDLADVAPGIYDLSFRADRGTAHLQVSVKASDLSVDLPIVGNGNLRGSVVLDGVPDGFNLDSSTVKATLVQMGTLIALSYPVQLSSTGALVADNIPAARYLLKVSSTAQVYAKSISVGGSESNGELDMSTGGTINVTIQLTAGLASVSGGVERNGNDHGRDLPSVNVVLIPAQNAPDGSGVYLGATDKAGHFSIGSIKPGTYRALALESLSTQILQDPSTLQTLENLGTQVDAKKNQDSTLELRLIASDEVALISAQLSSAQ